MLPPGIDGLRAHAVLLGHLRDRPLIGFAENRDHLLLGESGLLHGSLQTPRAPFSQALGGPKNARQVTTADEAHHARAVDQCQRQNHGGSPDGGAKAAPRSERASRPTAPTW